MKTTLALVRFTGTCLALALLCGTALTVRATTRIVTSASDNGGVGTLRTIISASVNGDTINFSAGLTGRTIVLTTSLTLGKNLTITGLGMTNLAISGNDACRVFEIPAGVTVSISGLTITGGTNVGTNAASLGDGGSAYGGGILNGGTLSLIGCNISGNRVRGGSGGDGYYKGGIGQGGGIYNYGNLTVVNSIINGNSAEGGQADIPGDGRGGGLQNDNGILTLTGCTISGNSARGGWAAYYGDNQLNGAPGYGGGIANNNGVLSLTNCTLTANAAFGGEGSQHNAGSGGAAQGGAIWNTGGSASGTWFSCTISGNSCVGGLGYKQYHSGGNSTGGGVLVINTAFTIKNTIISGNRATSGSGSLGGSNGTSSGPDVSGAIPTSTGFNLIGQTNGSSGWVSTDLTGSSLAPLNPLLGPLQNNGGPTPTMALLPGSAAIDNGYNGSGHGVPGLTTDQRGFSRPVDLHSYSGQTGANTTDIGAFELHTDDGPPLSVTYTNHMVMVSWLSLYAGYRLQVNINLANTNWVTPTETVNDNGTIKYILFKPPTGKGSLGKGFYRLMIP